MSCHHSLAKRESACADGMCLLYLAELTNQAVVVERERCAQVAQSFIILNTGGTTLAKCVAAAISSARRSSRRIIGEAYTAGKAAGERASFGRPVGGGASALIGH